MKAETGPQISLGDTNLLLVAIGKKLTVLSGTTVKLLCPADGLPQPDVFWEKDGRNITFVLGKLELERTSLVIKNISKEDEGTYFCVAYNSVGTDVGQSSVTVIRKYELFGKSFQFLKFLKPFKLNTPPAPLLLPTPRQPCGIGFVITLLKKKDRILI